MGRTQDEERHCDEEHGAASRTRASMLQRHKHTFQLFSDTSTTSHHAAAHLWPTKRPAMMAYWKSVVGVVRMSHRLAASGKGRSGGAP